MKRAMCLYVVLSLKTHVALPAFAHTLWLAAKKEG